MAILEFTPERDGIDFFDAIAVDTTEVAAVDLRTLTTGPAVHVRYREGFEIVLNFREHPNAEAAYTKIREAL